MSRLAVSSDYSNEELSQEIKAVSKKPLQDMKRTLTQFMDNQRSHGAGAVLGMKYHSIIGHGEAASDVKFVQNGRKI